jgi:hypothetical protein
MAILAGTFDETNPIPDNIPEIPEGCELILEPLAIATTALNEAI